MPHLAASEIPTALAKGHRLIHTSAPLVILVHCILQVPVGSTLAFATFLKSKHGFHAMCSPAVPSLCCLLLALGCLHQCGCR